MRYKFREQSSTAIQCQASNLSYALTQFQQWVEKKNRIATLMVLLGLGGGFWITIEVITYTQYALAQETGREVQRPQAYTERVDVSLDRQPNETYETLLRRAEAAAKSVAGASFDKNARITDVSVMIVAQNQGAIAPVLSLEVNRSQWRSRPDASWITYFTSARVLLQLEDIATTTAGQPGTNPTSRSGQPTATPAQSGTNPTSRSGQPANGIRPRTTNPNIGQPTNATPAQLGTTNPNIGQPTNATPAQPSTDSNIPTPSQQTPPPGSGLSPQAPTAAPVAPVNNFQTPSPGTGLSPQAPTAVPVAPVSNPMTPTIPNASSAPSNSLPTFGPQNPTAAPSNNGTTNNTSTTPNSTSPP